ncbi:MAG TPA: hypothetical protein VI731_00295 [Bacteroidia bacterium]|nr:hypothetical protein [Bacteroidia bacterium]
MKQLFLLPAIAVLFFSCVNEAEQKAEADSLKKEASRVQYISAVEKAEKDMEMKKGDKILEIAALKAYNDFAVMFPADPKTPEYLFRAGFGAQRIGNYPQAVVYYETIIEKHKNYPGYLDALMAAAYVYDTYLENVNHGADRAKQLYAHIIASYPDTRQAKDAAVLLKYVGVPDSVAAEEIIRNAGK